MQRPVVVRGDQAVIAPPLGTGRRAAVKVMSDLDRTEEFPEGKTIVAGPDGKPYPVAVVWRRVLARIIDAVTVFFIQWMLTVIQLLWFMDDVSTRWQPDPWGRATAAVLAYIFFHFVYTMVFLRWNEGQTPAMDLMNLRAVRTKDGSHLGLGPVCRPLVGGRRVVDRAAGGAGRAGGQCSHLCNRPR